MKAKIDWLSILIFITATAVFGFVQKVEAAVLRVSPDSGEFAVGDTFDVSLRLDTEGKEINTVQAVLFFPPDKLQLVSPAASNSILGIWASPIKYDNQIGKLELAGGIPNGLKTSNGLVYSLSFRVKSSGTAVIKFGTESQTLLNNGKGTKVKPRLVSGIFKLSPSESVESKSSEGPIVTSETHPDQHRWYRGKIATLEWGDEEGMKGCSHMLDKDPAGIPDDIAEERRSSVSYDNLSDGIYYFHIKARQEDSWGPTTHYAINVDATAPNDFPIEFSPGDKTATQEPVLEFATTDNLSGIDHYEIKIIPLQKQGTVLAAETSDGQMIFSEANSPFDPGQLKPSDYDVIVRAYDAAGNYSDAERRLTINGSISRLITSDGVAVGRIFVSWVVIIFLGSILCMILAYIAHKVKERNDYFSHEKSQDKTLQSLKEQLEELKKFRAKYGRLAMFLICPFLALFFSVSAVKATSDELQAPIVTNILKEVRNNEIFYVGGKTDTPNLDVILYLQNQTTGESISRTIVSDKKGDWFYRHDVILDNGEYFFWAKIKKGDEVSPASPQINVAVFRTLASLGSYQLNNRDFYLVALSVLFVLISVLFVFIVSRRLRIYREQKNLFREVKETREIIRQGFLILRGDIKKELEIIDKAEIAGKISMEEQETKTRLLADLDKVQENIGKEIADIEKLK